MNIAVISDIHSNCFALKAVLDDLENYNINNLIILGDIFGYYPWSVETYNLLQPYLGKAYCIKGNHDDLLLNTIAPNPCPSYWYAAKQNEEELKRHAPEAIEWLETLDFNKTITIGGSNIRMFHGTPGDPKNGRYYPDDRKNYDWDFKTDETILLGHTHYPMYKELKGYKIYNPGSVGQPRDGNPMPSWGIFDLENDLFKFVRTRYDNLHVIEKLYEIKWDEKSILSLNKKKQ